MEMSNQEIAQRLYDYAELLQASGDNPYRARSYKRAARTILNLDEELCSLLKSSFDLTMLPWIGKGISSVILHLLATGEMPAINYNNQVKTRHFIRLHHAIPLAKILVLELKSMKETLQVSISGELRRCKEIIQGIDLVVSTHQPQALQRKFLALKEISNIVEEHENRIIVSAFSGFKINALFVPPSLFAKANIELTGTLSHVNKLKKLSENDNIPLGNSEEEIYDHLHLQYIEPELREGNDEIELAKTGQLPKLIQLRDICGDLHSHTTETDGKDTLEVMVKAAIEKGYSYLAITDHSQRLKITNGMDERRLRIQIEEIDKLNEKLKHFKILKSMEVDILEDGSLDLKNEMLQELDIVVCSIHSRFKLSKDEQTTRIIKAMDNPYFNILGHATGRLIRSRPPYPISIETIFQAAKERNCIIELNAQPYRLDINNDYCQLAKAMGLKIAISSDAHSTRELNFMEYGIHQARRGWLEKKDVINTYSWSELKKLIKRV